MGCECKGAPICGDDVMAKMVAAGSLIEKDFVWSWVDDMMIIFMVNVKAPEVLSWTVEICQRSTRDCSEVSEIHLQTGEKCCLQISKNCNEDEDNRKLKIAELEV